MGVAVPPARETHHPRLRINRLVRKIDNRKYKGCKRSHTLISPRRANRVASRHACWRTSVASECNHADGGGQARAASRRRAQLGRARRRR
ncbi:MAG: hypothetical protein ACK56F_02430, partial [bacterium]